MDIKIGDPVYGFADGFGCVVEKDVSGYNIAFKVHYQSGKDEWNDWESTQNLIHQLDYELKQQELRDKYA